MIGMKSFLEQAVEVGAELEGIFHKAREAFAESKQYALVVKKGTFEKEEGYY